MENDHNCECSVCSERYNSSILIEKLVKDNNRMRSAGLKLSEAAIYTIREYDGLHRLSLAVAEWAKAIADEGDRDIRAASQPAP